MDCMAEGKVQHMAAGMVLEDMPVVHMAAGKVRRMEEDMVLEDMPVVHMA
jgi:hypothetical protein